MAMSPAIQGSYYDYQPKTSSTFQKYVSATLDDPSVIMPEVTVSVLDSLNLEKIVPLEPVYVKKIDGMENLIYRSDMMEPGKQYLVVWYNEHFVLIKNQSFVDIYKFYPDQ